MCCGQQRAAFAAPGARRAPAAGVPASPRAAPPAPPPTAAAPLVVFQCVGGAVAVTGAATGRRYHFMRNGERQAVDARDRPGLMQVAGLRWVR